MFHAITLDNKGFRKVTFLNTLIASVSPFTCSTRIPNTQTDKPSSYCNHCCASVITRSKQSKARNTTTPIVTHFPRKNRPGWDSTHSTLCTRQELYQLSHHGNSACFKSTTQDQGKPQTTVLWHSYSACGLTATLYIIHYPLCTCGHEVCVMSVMVSPDLGALSELEG